MDDRVIDEQFEALVGEGSKMPKNFGKVKMTKKIKAFERMFLGMRKIYCRRCRVYMTQTVCKLIKGKTCTKGCKGRRG